MKKLLPVSAIAFLLLPVFSKPGLTQIPYNSRYQTAIFTTIQKDSVVYGNAPALSPPYLNENNTFPQDLIMDIYQPVGDTLEARPAVICAHAGAFLTGTREADDMVAFCDSLAHRGYLAASIDYRLGMNIFSASSSIRAVYRAHQDARAAVRYLKEFATQYGIDTNNIYLLGSSAGGFMALSNLYLDTEAERPPESYDPPDLGCLDCSGNTYLHGGKTNGALSFWGALSDTGYIVQDDTIPLFLAHGTADGTVPFGVGSAFGNPYFPATYGSLPVSQRLNNFGHDAETYFVAGADHEFYGTTNGMWDPAPNEYWDTVFNKTVSFVYSIHKPHAGFGWSSSGYTVSFTDSSQGATNRYWDFGDGGFDSVPSPVHQYAAAGQYRVIQFVSNNLLSWDTLSQIIEIPVGLPEKNNGKINVYPNPAKDKITIETTGLKGRITIRNIYGNICFRQMISTPKTTLSVKDFPSGIYILTVHSDKIRYSLRFRIIR